MKHIRLFVCFLFASLLMLSCDDDSIKPNFKPLSIVGELPVYYEALTDSSLIVRSDLGEKQFEGCMINSKEELEAKLGEKFLTAYPEYGKIDFDEYTLLVRTDIIRNNVVARRSSFKQDLSTGHFIYYTDRLIKNGPIVPYVERSAIIVQKLEKNAIVEYPHASTFM